VKRLVVIFFFLASTTTHASELSTKAAALAPGHYATLNTNLTLSLMKASNGAPFVDWSDSGGWDQVSRKFRFLGKSAGTVGQNNVDYKFLEYDENSNSWTFGDLPIDPVTGNTLGGNGHGYDGNTADPVTGAHFFRPYGRATIFKWSGGAWTALADMPSFQSIVAGLAKSSSGLLYSEITRDIYLPNGSNTWVSVTSSSCQIGDYHSFAEYNPKYGLFLVGGGNNKEKVICKVAIVNAAPVRTKLNDAPINLGVGEAQSGTDLDSQHSNVTVDPVSGQFIVYKKVGVNPNNGTLDLGAFWTYDIQADSWAKIGNSGDGNMPPLPTGSNVFTIAAPINTYGVIMYVTYGSTANVYIYKHTPSTPDTTKPKAPRNLRIQ
jgi:hypothetical protein